MYVRCRNIAIKFHISGQRVRCLCRVRRISKHPSYIWNRWS